MRSTAVQYYLRESDPPIPFEWDPVKAVINLEKHEIDFRAATRAFVDPNRIDVDSSRPEHGEERRKVIGMVGEKLAAVIYTRRGRWIRVISARKVRSDERRKYDQGAALS